MGRGRNWREQAEVEMDEIAQTTDIPAWQETLNFWKQLTHVLKYFRTEEDPKAKLPKNFIQSFIEVSGTREARWT